jgi:hypothetical protein
MKQSFGNGYGINRKTGGASSLGTAVSPLSRVTVRPGSVSASAVGKTGKKHFQGAKSYDKHGGKR